MEKNSSIDKLMETSRFESYILMQWNENYSLITSILVFYKKLNENLEKKLGIWGVTSHKMSVQMNLGTMCSTFLIINRDII